MNWWFNADMADPLYNSYFAPLDNLLGPGITSPNEIIANRVIQGGNINPSRSPLNNESFQQILNSYQQAGKIPPAPGSFHGCNPLVLINCDPKLSIEKSHERIQSEIEMTINNIMNADKPGYKKTFTFLDEKGQPINDESEGVLHRSNWQLDLAIEGKGKGFELENGEFTRDGRFKYGPQGNLVTVEGEVPLKICYEDGAPRDWSLKRLKIDFEGKVVDAQTGETLGRVQADRDERSKILQHYIEKSNVNVPVEFMGLAQKLRLIDLTNNLFSSGVKLDGEAVQLLNRL